MKIYFKFSTLVSFAFIIYGCTISLSCVLLNNTESQLTIKQYFKTNRANETNTVAPGQTVLLKDWSFSNFIIESESGKWALNPKYVGGDFEHFSGWGPWASRVFYAQIEPNGSIYVLKGPPEKAVSNFPDQPDGFPIRPKTKN